MDQIKEYGPQVSGALGTVLSAKGQYDTGANADRALRYRAGQLERNAGQEVAAATMASQEEQRKSALISSRAIAVAAASGGGVLDPTVLKILQGIDAEGDLASATQMYNGTERARGLKEQANADRYESKLYRSAGRKKAMGTLLSGVTSIANTWGSSFDKPDGVFSEGTKQIDYDGRTTA